MKNSLIYLFTILPSFLGGCASDRLFFVDKAHLGLKAEANSHSTTPVSINFGYKRSFVTFIPCMETHDDSDQGDEVCGAKPKVGNDKKTAEEKNSRKPEDLLSVISVFNSKVTWLQGTRVHAYFATGKAATNTAQSPTAIKALVTMPNQ